MNCYDFDDTIFPGDSSMAFYRFCLLRHKRMMLRWPKQGLAFFRHYVLHSIEKTAMKEIFYEYFRDIPDMEKTVSDFWAQNLSKVKAFYPAQKQVDDVIISASPEFFLEPVCKALGIGCLIASQVDPKTGHHTGKNCHGEEKVRRFRERLGDADIENFYSDSLSDTPMAMLAKQAWLVRGEVLSPWPTQGKI